MMSLETSKIGSNIRNYIELNKAIEIPRVGQLKRTFSSCSFSTASHLFLPGAPQYTLAPTTGKDTVDFVLFLSEKLEISIETAQNLFKKFIGELVFDLEVKGKARVEGLGNFSSASGKYVFTQNTPTFRDENYALPVLQLKPIKPVIVEALHTTPRKTTSTDNSDKRFLAAVAAIAAIFILFLTIYDLFYQVDRSQSLLGIEIDQSRLNQNPTRLLVSEEIRPSVVPEVLPEEKQGPSCALIIGSFARESNANELEQKVIKAGYEVYTEDFHGFFRVGVAYDCSDIKGASFREVELALGVDPWLRIVR